MKELMTTKTFSYSELSKKYNNFHTPCCTVKAGTTDVKSLGLLPSEIEIRQTIKNKAGTCTFVISNGYDVVSQSFKDEIADNFPLGQTVEAGIGYITPVYMFKGFVTDISFSFEHGQPPSARITCSDIRSLMMQGKLNAMPELASFPIMMPLIMLMYTSILNMRIVYYDLWNLAEDFRQNTNDFNYLYNYGLKRGYEFFVLGEHCYFRKKWQNTSPLMTLKWGESIISFNRGTSYSSNKLSGSLSGLLSLIPFFSDNLLTPQGYPHKMATPKIPKVDMDTSEAKNTLDLINIMLTSLHNLGDSMASGTVTCVGIPEIIPGRYIRLTGLDSRFFDGDYYIEEVTHKFSSSGYITSFQIGSGK